MNCKLCKTIYKNKDEYENKFKNHLYELPAIIMEHENPCLYMNYSNTFINTYMQINFCPKCGRKINLKYKNYR